MYGVKQIDSKLSSKQIIFFGVIIIIILFNIVSFSFVSQFAYQSFFFFFGGGGGGAFRKKNSTYFAFNIFFFFFFFTVISIKYKLKKLIKWLPSIYHRKIFF